MDRADPGSGGARGPGTRPIGHHAFDARLRRAVAILEGHTMTRPHLFRVASLLATVLAPPLWLACGGGEQKPAESAAEQSSESSSSEAPAASSAAAEDTASAAPAAAASTAPPAETTPPPPPPPTFGSTDCGSCVDKACGKQVTACGKNPDCQSAIDSVHSCTSGGDSCVSGMTPPGDAKPKKLATAYQTCAKKALTGKTCKAKCQ